MKLLPCNSPQIYSYYFLRYLADQLLNGQLVELSPNFSPVPQLIIAKINIKVY